MGRFSWRRWPRGKNKSADDAKLSSERFDGGDRRQLLQALSAMVSGSALTKPAKPPPMAGRKQEVLQLRE
jgi:hypothetical protein